MNYFIALFFFFAIFPVLAQDTKEEKFKVAGDQPIFELNVSPLLPEISFTNITLNKKYQLPQIQFEGQYLFLEYKGKVVGDFIHQAEVKLLPVYGFHLGFNFNNHTPFLSLSHENAPNWKLFYKETPETSRFRTEPVIGISYSF